MPLSKFPITPKDFLDLEKTTLNFIKENSYFKEFSDRILGEAESEYTRLNTLNEKSFKKGLEILNFESYLKAKFREIQNRDCKVYFGGHIKLASKDSFEKISYYLALYDLEEKNLLRKFHFDFEPTITTQKSMIPSYHIQYAGTLSNYIRDDGVDISHENKIFSKLESPRIPYMPITLIQLLTIIFKSFNFENANKIITDDFWIGHLRKCEKKLSSNFFEICRKVNEDKSKCLLLNCFYHE